MSSYVFSLKGHAGAPERVELNLEDPEMACSHTVVAIGEMLRQRGEGFWARPEWEIGVTDETGRTVCTLTIRGRVGAPSDAANDAEATRARDRVVEPVAQAAKVGAGARSVAPRRTGSQMTRRQRRVAR